jgi:hypothetical protein
VTDPLSNTVRWTMCAILVVAGNAVLASHGLLVVVAGHRSAYLFGTLLLMSISAGVVIAWPGRADVENGQARRLLPVALTYAASAAILWSVTVRLLVPVFAGPLDSSRGDMLVIMEHAIERLLAGGNPYTVHHVPWAAPLTYGPLLWLPHLVSHLAGFDLRIYTLIAQLVIPTLCFVSAALRARQGHILRTIVLFGLGAAIALHPGIRGFHQIGHTQVYWPFFVVLCLLLREERWTAAAACLGLLGSARTPLLAMAPVFFLHLHLRRALTLRRVVAFLAAVVIPYLPFLIIDPAAVKEGMFDTYVRVMKTYVWQSTRWAVDTYGVTGRLLESGQQAYVEIVQLSLLLAAYALAWRSMSRGRRPEPWLAVALLVFAMTTLWSVVYLYYDVWLLLTCALVVADGTWSAAPLRRSGFAVSAAFAVGAVLVFTAAAVKPGSRFTLDIGDPAVSGFTGGGFGADVPRAEDGRIVVWVEGPNARIRLPRAAWTGAEIRLAIRPHLPDPGARQTAIAALNGHMIGSAALREGWQEIAFTSRRQQWLFGFNVLDLFFAYAAPGVPASKDFAAAIDFVTVE